MKEKLSPKVEALYEAVKELLLEGKEIRKMKVSEITERAGIGKGTAYEYFESREELLMDSLDYFQATWAEGIQEKLSDYDGFMEKIDFLLGLLDDTIKRIRKEALAEIFDIFFSSPMFRKEKGGMVKRMQNIVEEAKRGGELREELPNEYIVLALMGKTFSYISYCMGRKHGMPSDCTTEEMKGYLLDSIRKEFLVKQ